MKKKKLRKDRIIILFIILILLFTCLEVIRRKNLVKYEQGIYSEEFRYSMKADEGQIVDPLSENTVLVKDGYKFFSKYYRKIDAKEIQENWDNLTRIAVPKYCNYITSSEKINDYYKNNEKEILLETGIDDEKNFELFINKITSKFTKKLNKLEELKILDEAKYDSKKNETKTRLRAIYENGENIIFDITVYDKKDSNGVFIIYE